MSQLTLTGVSDDRTRLLLVDDAGIAYTLEITPSLRSALRGDVSRLGQLENQMDSALRPRDIQARIRAGETAEQVAQAAQTSVERIMPFVSPVLAERQHVAERAQRSSLRRTGGEGTARNLGEAVSAHLRGLNVDPDSLEWDAWRRDDGRWALVAEFAAGARSGLAHFIFDAPGNYVVLDDDDARWLVGEAAPPAAPPVTDDLQQARARRLATAPGTPAEELPLGTDAIEMVTPAETPPAAREADVAPEPAAQPAAEQVLEQGPEQPALIEDPVSDDAPDEPALRRPVQKRKGRASVPSWDEIMFGGSDQ